MVRFGEAIQVSIEWTATVLFRPFRPKKWLILTFVALMAGYLANFGNLGNSSNFGRKEKAAEAAVTTGIPTFKEPLVSAPATPSRLDLVAALKDAFAKTHLSLPLAAAIGAAVILLMVLMMWLSARFQFVFLEDITRNDASIKAPFRLYRREGNSLWLFYLVYGVIALTFLGVVIWRLAVVLNRFGVFQDQVTAGFGQIALACLPGGLSILILITIGLVMNLFLSDFVAAVMYKDRIRVMEAWSRVLALISSHRRDCIKYFFIVIGLRLCTLLLSFFVFIAAFLSLFIPALIIVGLFISVAAAVPILRIPLLAVLILAFLCGVYFSICLGLPFAVFFRTLSIKCLARMDPRYNLFSFSSDTRQVSHEM